MAIRTGGLFSSRSPRYEAERLGVATPNASYGNRTGGGGSAEDSQQEAQQQNAVAFQLGNNPLFQEMPLMFNLA